jgi:hypothetical protein
MGALEDLQVGPENHQGVSEDVQVGLENHDQKDHYQRDHHVDQAESHEDQAEGHVERDTHFRSLERPE